MLNNDADCESANQTKLLLQDLIDKEEAMNCPTCHVIKENLIIQFNIDLISFSLRYFYLKNGVVTGSNVHFAKLRFVG